jgi:hypothetical protein
MQRASTGNQNLVESPPTFTLNVELYRLTVLAMREIFRQRSERSSKSGGDPEPCGFEEESWDRTSSHVATTRAEMTARSSIDIALVADFTQTR